MKGLHSDLQINCMFRWGRLSDRWRNDSSPNVIHLLAYPSHLTLFATLKWSTHVQEKSPAHDFQVCHNSIDIRTKVAVPTQIFYGRERSNAYRTANDGVFDVTIPYSGDLWQTDDS